MAAASVSTAFAEPTIQELSNGGAKITYESGAVRELTSGEVDTLKHEVDAAGIDGGATGQTAATLPIPGETEVETHVGESFVETLRKGVEGGDGASVEELYGGLDDYMMNVGTDVAATSLLEAAAPVVIGAATTYVAWKAGEKLLGLIGFAGSEAEGWKGIGTVSLVKVSEAPLQEPGSLTVLNNQDNAQWERVNCPTDPECRVTVPSSNVAAFWRHSEYGGVDYFGWGMQYTPIPKGSTLSAPQLSRWGTLSEPYSGDVYGAYETQPSIAQRMGSQSSMPGSQLSLPPGTRTVTVPAPAPLTVAPPLPSIANVDPNGGSVVPEINPLVSTTIYHDSPDGEKQLAPDPVTPELPRPGHDELATTYKEKLEREGWTKVKLEYLPETAIDPNTGPGDASYTNPSGKVQYETEVKVETNPETAPEPNEPAAPLFTAPTASLKLPTFGAVCKNFPFGVPCWIVSLFEKWVAPGKAPKLEVPVMGEKLVADLSVIEPMMEVLRPVFGIASVIGIVVTFFSFAIGGSGGTTGGGDDD